MITKSAAKYLREIYVGEYVTLYLKDMNVITVNEDQQEVSITAMRQAIVVDVDQNFFYLGLPDGMITSTVAHELAQMVEIEFIDQGMMDQDMPQPGEETH